MAGIGALVIACSPAPPMPAPPDVRPAAITAPPDHFSGEIAKFHVETLAAFGPRPPGSEADRAARLHLSRQLTEWGATVQVVRDGERRHLVADFPGESEDTLLLVGAYPSLAVDAWIGDSALGLLLELARVISHENQLYSLRLAWAETTDAAIAPAHELDTHDTSTPEGEAVARQRVVAAGESLVRALESSGGLDGLRAILVFEGASRSKLRIARDLRSHPVYRDVFWASARDLGLESVFPLDSGWASPRSLNLAFLARALDGVVAIVDEARARPELEPAPTSRLEDSAESFEAIGRVTLEAIDRIMHRLSRIDRFAEGDVFPRSPDPENPVQATPKDPEDAPSS